VCSIRSIHTDFIHSISNSNPFQHPTNRPSNPTHPFRSTTVIAQRSDPFVGARAVVVYATAIDSFRSDPAAACGI